MAKCCGKVYLLAIKNSAAENQSSKTFCFFSNIPCWCQFSPYSPPPRKLAQREPTARFDPPGEERVPIRSHVTLKPP